MEYHTVRIASKRQEVQEKFFVIDNPLSTRFQFIKMYRYDGGAQLARKRKHTWSISVIVNI